MKKEKCLTKKDLNNWWADKVSFAILALTLIGLAIFIAYYISYAARKSGCYDALSKYSPGNAYHPYCPVEK